MGKVRQAGYLFRREKDSYLKHWCVVRDKSFIVYPSQPKIKNISPDTDGSPIHILPVDELSISKFIAPANATRFQSKCSLQLYSASSDTNLIFYIDQEGMLEKWVQSIRDECTMDDLAPQNTPHGTPFPPDLSSDPISLSPNSTKPLKSSFEKPITAKTYFDDVQRTKSEITKYPITQSKEKQSGKKLLKAKAISSVVHENSQDFTHPVTSSSSKRVMTSSPRSVQEADRKESFSRKHAVPPTHKRRKDGPFPSLRRSPMVVDNHSGFTENSTIPTLSAAQDKRSATLYGTINQATLNRLRPSEPEPLRRVNSSKRHTICEVPEYDFMLQEELQLDLKSKSTAKATSSNKPKTNRYSIAPLSSLDLRLRQKKKSRKTIFQAYSSKSKSEEQKSRNSSIQSSDEDESTVKSIQQPSVTSNDNHDRGNSKSNFRPPDSDVISRQLHLDAGGLNLSLPNLADAEEKSAQKPSGLVYPRKTSELVGLRTLKRVSSAKGKPRHKSQEENPLHDLFESTQSQNESMSKTSGDSSIPELDSPSATDAEPILMKGWLYRRKMMSWSKMWAVLTADQMLKFYKSNRTPSNSETLLKLDLEKGFSIEDIQQDKSFNSFWLHPKSKTTDVDLNSSLKEEAFSQSWIKPIQLMCKSTQEFMHWMKEFLLLNSASFKERRFRPNSQRSTSQEEANNRNKIENKNKDELNNNLKDSFKRKEVSTLFLSQDSDILEEKLENQNFNIEKEREKSSSESSSNSESSEKPISELVSPTIKVTFCDGNTSESESQIASWDRNFHLKSDNSFKKTEKFSEQDAFKKAPGKLSREKVNQSETLRDTNVSFPSVSQESRTKYTLTESDGIDSLLTKDTGGKDKTPSHEWTGNYNQLTDHLLTPETSEQQITNELNLSEKVVDILGKSDCNKTRSQICEANFADGVKTIQSCRVCDKNSNDVIGREIEKEKVSNPPDVADTKTITPFFSRNQSTPLQKISVTDSISVANERCSSSAVGLSPEKPSLDLPAINKRIKLFESFASGANKISCLKEPVNFATSNENRQSSLETSSFKSELNFESSFSISLNTSKTKKFKSVEDLRNLDAKELCFLSLPESDLRRATSDSNLLELKVAESSNMRRGRKSIPQLSEIDLIEIYGIPKSLNNSRDQFVGIDDITTAKRRNSVESDENSIPAKDYSEENSIASLLLDSKANSLAHSDSPNQRLGSESGASECSNTKESRPSWRFSSKVKLRKSPGRSGESYRRGSKEQILQVPASQIINASHRGYLEKRSKRKQWEKFWCVFQDTCLYFYNSPHSGATRDVIVLRGYEVIADVTNTNRERFEFRLQQEGSRTLYFSSDNFEEYLLWVGTLERETRTIRTPDIIKSPDFLENFSGKNDSSTNVFQPSSSGSSSAPSPMLRRSLSDDPLELEIVEMQKYKLLKELASQQEKLREEQQSLDRLYGTESLRQTQEQSRSNANKRQDVIRKFDRVREIEEAKVTKTMAFLNCRRNSAQLKLDQLAKELAPKSGKKRRDDHKYFAALESKQAEMKQKLAKVDQEIYELQAKKQNAFEKIQERQDLALVVAEQQENLDILKRNPVSSSGELPVVRTRHKSHPVRKRLSSINEIKHFSESSVSSDSGSDDNKLRSKLTPFYQKRSGSPPVFDDLSKEVHPLTILRSLSTDVNFGDYNLPRSYSSDESLSKNPTSLSSSLYSLGSSTEFLQQSSSSSTNRRRSKDEVDPSVIAGIEDFEKFSAKMLEKSKKNGSSSK